MVKNPPANAGEYEIQVRSLGREDPLEKEMATHSSILAWEWGRKESDMTQQLNSNNLLSVPLHGLSSMCSCVLISSYKDSS